MNKKILLVTGKLAEESVRKYSAESGVDTVVKTLPVSVAAFITSELLIDQLGDLDLSGFSMLMVPGLARCDLKKIEDKLGLPTFKGPKYAADIPLVLGNLEKLNLSKEIPACELLKSEMRASAHKRLKEVEEAARGLLSEPHNFLIGEGKFAVTAGKDFPARVIAEINNAPTLEDEEVIEIAKWYLESGAEIIDIGMIAWEERPEEVRRLLSVLKDNFNVPISIDTLNRKEIQAAIENGVDLILSVSGDTIEDFKNLDIPAVVVPVDPKRGYYPRDPHEKIGYLLDLVKRAKELGYAQIIADPILEPVNQGFVESLMAFYELRKLEPNLPILMGVGNVVELYDADSVGMNALLAGVASELNASFLLTVEASDKSRGAVAELRRARDMMTLARSRGSVPKDLGLDLLLLKNKKRYSDVYDRKIEDGLEVIEAKPVAEFKLDPKGTFKIFVNRSELIAVLYAQEGPKIVVKGKTAEEVCHEIIERGLISEMKHASYLGRELQKAEIAIKTGKGYLQDKELF